nr:MAG TPA: hypothetical protein [Caudoviricetes sp.]
MFCQENRIGILIKHNHKEGVFWKKHLLLII